MMLFYDFEKLIDEMSNEGVSEDYWYDVGVIDAQNILEGFSLEDWKLLETSIKNKSIEWKKRAIYSFDGENSEKEVKIILNVIETEDEELLDICIDSLRCMISINNQISIEKYPELILKIKRLASSCNNITKKLYIDFLEKIEND